MNWVFVRTRFWRSPPTRLGTDGGKNTLVIHCWLFTLDREKHEHCYQLFSLVARYARNNAGNFGVIPENYVESLLDPPEPNEPPPPLPPYPASISSFSSHGSYNNGNNNRSNYSPNVDSHEYMNPASLGNWAAQSDPNNWRQIQRTVRKWNDQFYWSVCFSEGTHFLMLVRSFSISVITEST